MNMKQILLVAMMVAGTLAFGAANDMILTFSTQGPDTYGDKTCVLDGERYALVWVKDNTEFTGLSADCRPLGETTKVIAVAPLAKDGRCPETVFEIDADFAETLAGGSFALYLLDTRVSATELAQTENGAPASVNALGRVDGVARADSDANDSKDTIAVGGDGVARADSDANDSKDTIAVDGIASMKAGTVSLAEVGVYTKIDEPTITAMRVEGAKIVLTVSGMSGAAEYVVVKGAEPGKVGAKMTTTVKGDKLIVDKPADDSAFLKVLGVRKFE